MSKETNARRDPPWFEARALPEDQASGCGPPGGASAAPYSGANRGATAGADLLFIANVEKSSARWRGWRTLRAVPGAVADYLAAQNLPGEFVMAPHPELQGIAWSERPRAAAARGARGGDHMVSVQHGYAGVAETGTLMLRPRRSGDHAQSVERYGDRGAAREPGGEGV